MKMDKSTFHRIIKNLHFLVMMVMVCIPIIILETSSTRVQQLEKAMSEHKLPESIRILYKGGVDVRLNGKRLLDLALKFPIEEEVYFLVKQFNLREGARAALDEHWQVYYPATSRRC